MKVFSRAIVFTAILAAFIAPAASIDLNSSYALRYFPDNTMEFSVGTTGDVDVKGNITMNTNSLEGLNGLYGDTSGGNFFEGTCGNNQVVDGINADGTYNCVNVNEESSADTLNATLLAGDIANQSIRMNGNDLASPGNITGYWDTMCSGGKVVEHIYNNGSVRCIDPSEDQGVETLNATLEAGNEANQSIDMMGNDVVRIDNLTFNEGLAIDSSYGGGGGASAGSGTDIAIGTGAAGNGGKTVALGHKADATSFQGIAIGDSAVATDQGIALGVGSEVGSKGGVAIGRYAVAPNAYEATFGNLSGAELDVNVTGNLTVHGVGGVEVGGGTNTDASFYVQDNGVARLGTQSSDSFEFITNDNFRFKVDSSGNIGIGESNPGSALEVASGNVNITGGNLTVKGEKGVEIPNGDLKMNGNNIDGVGEVNSGGDQVDVGGDVNMTGSSPKFSMGGGMSVQRTGGNLVISD